MEKMQIVATSLTALVVMCLVRPAAADQDPWVVYEGKEGPGKGHHIVLVSGDEEYRSEEALPMLAKILAVHHGFKCTVLFAIGKDGVIDPLILNNIPGLQALESADVMIIATRFRDLPDDQMKHIDDYLKSGKPVIGLRTATHAFNIKPGKTYSKYSFRSKEWDGGFGRQILGETWAGHHGHHGKESTRGLIAEGAKDSPLVRGIKDGDIWGPTDVYGVHLPLPGDSKPIIMGQVLVGMKPDDAALEGAKNDPMMPVAWTKSYQMDGGKTGQAFTTTMGASQDFTHAGLRRLLVNACYWAVGQEDKITADAKVDVVGPYEPRPFGFKGFTAGVRPADLQL